MGVSTLGGFSDALALTRPHGGAYNTDMEQLDVVLDTNVLVAGLRSRHGAAFKLLSLVGTGRFEIHLSVPLVLEYEDVLLCQAVQGKVDHSLVRDVLDFYCAVGQHEDIFFLWRPYLRDPGDDMVLELAVRAGCNYIVTYNTKDFARADRFGVDVLTPAEFLGRIGGL